MRNLKMILSSLIILSVFSCDGFFENTKEADKLIEGAWRLKETWYSNPGVEDFGKLSKAEEYFDKAIEVAPNYAVTYYNKGLSQMFFTRNKYGLSLITYKTKRNKDSKDKEYHTVINNMNKAIELDSTYFEAYYYRAIAKQKIGDSLKSISDLKLYISNEYENRDDARLRLGMALFSTHKYKEAIRLLNREKDDESYNIIGKAKFAIGDVYGAIASFTKAIGYTDDVSKIRFYNNRGKVYVHLKDFKKAYDDFTKAHNLYPVSLLSMSTSFIGSSEDHGYSTNGAITLIYLSLCKSKLDLDYTISYMHYAINLDDNNPQIHLIAGNILKDYFDDDNINLACQEWSKAGELGSDEAYRLIKKNCN